MKRTTLFCAVLLLGVLPAGAGQGAHHTHEPPAHSSPHGGLVRSVGTNHLELTFDERSGRIALYVLGEGQRVHPIEAEPLTVRVEPAEPDGFNEPLVVELLPISRKQDPPGLASRFVGGTAELIDLSRFRVTPRVRIAGRTHETTFLVEEGAFATRFVCPMDCEGMAYPKAGSCPVCNMRLQLAEEAHMDHSPKHGGVLFMAPNGWHHLEGVVSPTGEFRLYLYNDFTKPISAVPFAKRAWIDVDNVKLPLSPTSSGEFLRTLIESPAGTPLDVVLHLQFEGREKPDRFDFRFE